MPHPLTLASLRLLVVEDHPVQRGALVAMLHHLGIHDVLQAEDGRAALEQLRTANRPVDVVITDLDMPGMDGVEFLRHVGQSHPGPAVVLATAVNASVLSSLREIAAGYDVDLLGLLRKPVREEQLADLLARRRPARDPRAAPSTHDAADVRGRLQAGEFEPFFQPKVHMDSGRVGGFEALARWRTAAGVVAPAGFMAALEAQGLIDALTWHMLDKSLAFARQLRASGPHCSVSVNLSATTLRDPDFANAVTARTAAAGVEPRCVLLEVTESAAAGDARTTALENLTRLRMRGFGLAIDDFGTGYSSLERLARVPFTELKIDRSFVCNAAGDEAAAILLESSLQLAHRLKLTTVAEGVETQAQWDLLRRLDCDLAQGYLVAHPMPAGEALQWLAAWNAQPTVAL